MPPTINTTGKQINLQEGLNITLHCLFDGLPPPAYGSVDWFHNDTRIISITPRKSYEIFNATSYRPGIQAFSTNLTVSNIKQTDSGIYSCQVKNGISPTAKINKPYVLNVSKGGCTIDWFCLIILLFLMIFAARSNFCVSSPCQNGGVCTSTSFTFLCECLPDWVGFTCEKSR